MAYRPTEKTEARKKAQHQLLLNTSLAIVAEHGFQALTIASLAERANVAIGTVYKYFDSKALLCADVFKLGTEKEVNQVQKEAFPESTNASHAERLENALKTFSVRAIAGRRLAYALIAEPVDSKVQEERLKYRRAYANIFAKLIKEGIENSEFPPQDEEVSAAAIVGLLAETLLGPIGTAIANNKDIDEDALLDNILNFCLRAVGATDS